MQIDRSMRERWTRQDSSWTFEIPQGWMQGRSVFGGLTVAAMAALARRVAVPQVARGLRTLSSHLMAPVVAGPLHGDVEVLREGRNITFVRVNVSQDGRTIATSTMVFAASIDSQLDVPAPHRADPIDPQGFPELPYVEGVVPEFTQHAQLRWVEGGMPFSGATEAAFTGVFRYRVPLGDVEGLLVLADTWPAPSMSLAKRPIPASTVSWTAHVVTIPEEVRGWYTMRYETLVGERGLHTIVGHLYAPDGTLVCWSEQLAAVFG